MICICVDILCERQAASLRSVGVTQKLPDAELCKRKDVTTKSLSSKAVDSVIQGEIKSTLKSEGFRKSGRTFHRPKGEMIQGVYFETSWLNTPDEAQFTVDLNVVLPFYHEKWTGEPLPNNPGSAAPLCSRRLGHLLPTETDKWWTVTPSTDCVPLSRELAELIRSVGLPYLDKSSDIQFLLENLGSDRPFADILTSQTLAFAILLCHLGREEEARRVLDETRSSNRVDGFGETIDSVQDRLGLASSKPISGDAHG